MREALCGGSVVSRSQVEIYELINLGCSYLIRFCGRDIFRGGKECCLGDGDCRNYNYVGGLL